MSLEHVLRNNPQTCSSEHILEKSLIGPLAFQIETLQGGVRLRNFRLRDRDSGYDISWLRNTDPEVLESRDQPQMQRRQAAFDATRACRCVASSCLEPSRGTRNTHTV